MKAMLAVLAMKVAMVIMFLIINFYSALDTGVELTGGIGRQDSRKDPDSRDDCIVDLDHAGTLCGPTISLPHG